jgi:ABC-type proline/glycine betaine transport system permease subunit
MSRAGWNFRPAEYLLSDLRQMVQAKSVGQTIMFVVLFLLAMLAIFDTQVLSVFRRRREIGMLIALGMTRAKVIVMITLEVALHSVLAALLGILYAGPLFIYLNRNEDKEQLVCRLAQRNGITNGLEVSGGAGRGSSTLPRMD